LFWIYNSISIVIFNFSWNTIGCLGLCN
jgi:hypothetical protein